MGIGWGRFSWWKLPRVCWLLLSVQARMCDNFVIFQKYFTASLLGITSIVELALGMVVELQLVGDGEACFINCQVSIGVIMYVIST